MKKYGNIYRMDRILKAEESPMITKWRNKPTRVNVVLQLRQKLGWIKF